MLWRRIVSTLSDWITALFHSVKEVPAVKWLLIAFGASILIAIIARAFILSRVDPRTSGRSRARSGRSLWDLAAGSAADGDFIGAAHLLYLALIESIAERERLRLHPSKTIGDYVRDLRRSSSTALPVLSDFAKVYQPIVWGSRECDAGSYETLRHLAERVRSAA